jgi:hypothetical protein
MPKLAYEEVGLLSLINEILSEIDKSCWYQPRAEISK